MRKVLIFVVLVVGLSAFAANAQTKRELLTNAKIIELVRLGLDEEIIVEKIRQSDCQCDTSTEALTKLKAARVSKPIIMAMLEAASGTKSYSETPGETTPSKSVPQAPVNSNKDDNRLLSQLSEPGIYLVENGGLKLIEPSVFSGGKVNPLMTTLTYGIKKAKWRAKVRGRSANLQTALTKPEFYFVFNPEFKNSGATMAGLFWGMPATSPAEFILVQMNQKDASREAVLGEYGVWTGASMGARDKDIREYSFEKIKPGIYKVVPKEALALGEYCFYYAGNVTGIGFAGGKVFDFTVQAR